MELWTKEKGEKVAFKYWSIFLGDLLYRYLQGDGALEEYDVYLSSMNQALPRTGQPTRGKGTHALRYAFAQRRFRGCLRAGFTNELAKR
ncbi:MAG: hypothetical protein AB7E32_17800 [Desulfovibrio sp.]